MEKRGRSVLGAALVLIATTVSFSIIGALGPVSSQGSYHAMYMCVVSDASKVIRDRGVPLIDEKSCETHGQHLEVTSLDTLRHYPLENVIFYTQIPYVKKHVMSRMFQFLLTDMGLKFSTSDYLALIDRTGINVVKFEVTLGYRDGIKGPWKRKTSGNVTRSLNCQKSTNGFYSCDHFPLFELGSCHHKQYVINLQFRLLPLSTIPQYSGLAPIQKIHIYEVHQSLGFTRLWLILKTIIFPLTTAVLLWYLGRFRRGQPNLIERLLLFLGISLVMYNAPLEYLSLYFDCPWLLVVNDFRQGLFIAAMFTFWITFVNEHHANRDTPSHLGVYWKQLAVVSLSSIFFFVYEFCERGIQVVFPFYSLWSNWLGQGIAWLFISIAGSSALLYSIIFLITTARVYWSLRKKQSELASLAPAAQQRFQGLFFQLKFFIAVTVVVAICSIATVILPTEIMLHQWQHGNNDYSVYSALLTGNYGMWNAYAIIMMILYAPPATTRTPSDSGIQQGAVGGDRIRDQKGDPAVLQKFLNKTSQE